MGCGSYDLFCILQMIVPKTRNLLCVLVLLVMACCFKQSFFFLSFFIYFFVFCFVSCGLVDGQDNTALILMGGGDTHDGISAVGSLTKWINNFRGILSQCVYQIVPYIFLRWMVTMTLGAMYALRVYYAPGYDMVSFSIGTFAVMCLGLFLTPKGDLELEELGSASLPVKCSDEFKPFVRRLPEFDFW